MYTEFDSSLKTSSCAHGVLADQRRTKRKSDPGHGADRKIQGGRVQTGCFTAGHDP